ncbi:Hypothetical_protein [Hexamita inflata]|uniref:Hypothetical_protein n=1 Tax=Hexamita inflata TaxID=28002 RepID=A0ABP1HWQ9_9EUKA
MPPPSFLNQWNIQSTQAFSENNRFFMTIQRYEAVRTLAPAPAQFHVGCRCGTKAICCKQVKIQVSHCSQTECNLKVSSVLRKVSWSSQRGKIKRQCFFLKAFLSCTDDLRQEAELKRFQLPQTHPELSTNLNQLRESKDYYFQIMKYQQQHRLSDILNILLKYAKLLTI